MMIFKDFKQVFLCFLVGISGIAAMARADNWSHKRPNSTAVLQNQRGQAGYRPAIGFQQPLPRTQGQSQYNNTRHQQQQPQWPQPNNRSQNNYPSSVPQGQQNSRNNQTQYHPQQSAYGQRSYNQTRPGFGSNNPTQYHPSQPIHGQGSYNQTRPAGPSTNSHLYPPLPNNPSNIPVFSSNSWSPPANQTLVYPHLPNKPVPVQSNVANNGIPLAPLQPQNPQGPQNVQSGGQAALSYGPGHYSQPAGSSNNNPPIRQGSSNPYANMFN